MAKVKITGNAVVITSALLVTDIKKVAKFTKSGLTLKDDKGNDVFSIALGRDSSISKFGITYAGENSEGYAQATLLLDEDIAANDRKESLLDEYAIEFANLNTLETFLRESIADINHTIAAVDDTIEVVD